MSRGEEQSQPARHDLRSVLSWFGEPLALLSAPAFRSRHPQYESETDHTPVPPRPWHPVAVTFEHILQGGRVIQVATRRKRAGLTIGEHLWWTLRGLVANELGKHGWRPEELGVVLASHGPHPPMSGARTLEVDGAGTVCPFMEFDGFGVCGFELERVHVAVAGPVACFEPPGIALEITGGPS
jgi:hypothetical protein